MFSFYEKNKVPQGVIFNGVVETTAHGNCNGYPLPHPNHSNIHSYSYMWPSHAHTCVHRPLENCMVTRPLPTRAGTCQFSYPFLMKLTQSPQKPTMPVPPPGGRVGGGQWRGRTGSPTISLVRHSTNFTQQTSYESLNMRGYPERWPLRLPSWDRHKNRLPLEFKGLKLVQGREKRKRERTSPCWQLHS